MGYRFGVWDLIPLNLLSTWTLWDCFEATSKTFKFGHRTSVRSVRGLVELDEERIGLHFLVSRLSETTATLVTGVRI